MLFSFMFLKSLLSILFVAVLHFRSYLFCSLACFLLAVLHNYITSKIIFGLLPLFCQLPYTFFRPFFPSTLTFTFFSTTYDLLFLFLMCVLFDFIFFNFLFNFFYLILF